MDGSHNPLRPVDWRWRLINLPSNLGQQRWHVAAKSVAEHYPELATDRRRLAGYIRRAHEIDGSAKIERWLLRASILAGESDEQIEARLNVPAPVARVYEAVFFNVRDRLQAKDYIRCQALVLGFMNDPVGRIGHWYARAAYHRGVEALDQLQPLVMALVSSKRFTGKKPSDRNGSLLELAIGLDTSAPGSPEERYWMRLATYLAGNSHALGSPKVSSSTQTRVYKELAAELFRPQQPKVSVPVPTQQPRRERREELVPV
jgi:hypothetical protein